ncbi:hypothetical protein Anas_11083 [Armadillidium nasatum]|uniref:Uncharacterized protein n=1 Tax=Armadillidium nasatum TaxID=96803 RepID=A0A5N5SQV4_9CRUS|nr:hypothetical protein Anas_03929 [Armadillidium nasatum]KAB7505120.1 hypothetical protein Anas_11083 [Armadillidium nasatum]
MKNTVTKFDIEKILHGILPNSPKMKIKNDGSVAIINAYYLHFLKTMAEETDKLLYMDGVQTLKRRHIKAAGGKCLEKFSYRCLVRANLPSITEETQSQTSVEEE